MFYHIVGKFGSYNVGKSGWMKTWAKKVWQIGNRDGTACDILGKAFAHSFLHVRYEIIITSYLNY